jgi:hypothetical protein
MAILTDCEIVVYLWKQLGGSNTAFLSSDCCNVNGISCDSSNTNVNGINWSSKNLIGAIPSSISNLISRAISSIPTSLPSSYSGPIPTIGNLNQLKTL